MALPAYVANKSNDAALKVFSIFTSGLFVVYCVSYITQRLPVAKSGAANTYVRWGANLLIAAFSLLVFYSWTTLVIKALDEVAKVQR